MILQKENFKGKENAYSISLIIRKIIQRGT